MSENKSSESETPAAVAGAAPCSADESSKPKFRPDWFSPIFPAICVFQALSLIHSKKDGLTEIILSTLMAMMLCYVAFFNLINVLRRNPPNDPSSPTGREQPKGNP